MQYSTARLGYLHLEPPPPLSPLLLALVALSASGLPSSIIPYILHSSPRYSAILVHRTQELAIDRIVVHLGTSNAASTHHELQVSFGLLWAV